MIRSILFVMVLYGSMALIGLAAAPAVLLKPKTAFPVIRFWVRLSMATARLLLGIRWQAAGLENLPNQPVLVAGKHLSMLDVMLPFLIIDRPCFVLKKELLNLPIFGWYARKTGMIAIDREGAMASLKAMVAAAREAIASGRSIVIFPEGTRQSLNAPPDYKPGVAALYSQLKLDCVPLALDTGRVWPAHGMRRHSGMTTLRFLPAIPAGLKRHDFMAQLETAIETGTNNLLAQDQPTS